MSKKENVVNWSKLEKFPELVDWEKTPEVIGFPVKISKGITTYGEAEFLHMELEDGETVSIVLGSALSGYDWNSLFGTLVKIAFDGEEKSKNHKGKIFRNFSVYLAE